MKFYAVKKGRNIGIFRSWEKCQESVQGFSGAVFKSFKTQEEAISFLENKSLDVSTEMENIGNYAYIDGSFDKTSEIYGSGVVLVIDNKKVEHKIAGKSKEISSLWNVAGELEAAKYVMSYALDNNISEITIFYDYEGIERWANGDWRANLDYTKNYVDFVKKIRPKVKIHFVKVKAHSGIIFNELADKLAKEAIQEFKDKIVEKKENNDILFGSLADSEMIKEMKSKKISN